MEPVSKSLELLSLSPEVVRLAEAVLLTKANRNTLKRTFSVLVARGDLRLLGAGRGARYEPAR